MNAPLKQEMRVPALAGGGNVMAIIPQDMDQVWRLAKAVYLAGLAPSALIGKLEADAAISAVAVSIMSGAELGLKPMVALRSFTVINGKPALYGDGLINVIRQSGKVTYLRTGCDTVGGKMVGWCEAKRNDTGEYKRVEFSQEDAERAGLWQSEAIVTKWNKWDKKNEQKPNDSPWYRFPQRMLAWRAAGYCLRELFGDVLGGIRDEYEAREIADTEEMRDITPRERPVPPKPPAPPAPPAEIEDAVTVYTANEGQAESVIDYGDFFERLEAGMSEATDEASVEECWTEFDPEATLQGDDDSMELAFNIKHRRLAALNVMNGG